MRIVWGRLSIVAVVVVVLFVLWPIDHIGAGPIYDLKLKDDSMKESALSAIPSLPSFKTGSQGKDAPEQVTVREVQSLYDRSVVAWEEEYAGKKVEIRGVVVSIGLVDPELLRREGLNADYSGYVGLVDDDGRRLPTVSPLLPAGDLFCTFHARDQDEFAELRHGHIVKMIGVGKNYSASQWGPTFRDCRDVQITGIYVSPR